MTVESDKASMDIPAASSGTITEILVKVGDSVSEGDSVFKTDGTTETASIAEPKAESPAAEPTAPVSASAASSEQPSEVTITVPDLGGANDVEVIDLLVAEGDTVEADQPIITVESDKASMDIPSSHAGVIQSMSIKVGDTVNEGEQILVLSATISSAEPAPAQTAARQSPAPQTAPTC